ncbi:MAG: ASPIC/UnbV domain-containing protein [Candidatus Nealsonbacteria bacterium]|nr:ASPIC/UnbV domain-containing protein [Candidatus Nealsonbacteria bacterium]
MLGRPCNGPLNSTPPTSRRAGCTSRSKRRNSVVRKPAPCPAIPAAWRCTAILCAALICTALICSLAATEATAQIALRDATVLRNDTANGNHWTEIRLCGTRTNRDGVGARVKVVAGDLTQIDEVHSGRGYQSHYGTRLHFGLGKHRQIDRIEVRWIGGGVEVFDKPGIDRLVTLTEGTGAVQNTTLGPQ